MLSLKKYMRTCIMHLICLTAIVVFTMPIASSHELSPPRVELCLASRSNGSSCLLYMRVTNRSDRIIHFTKGSVANGTVSSAAYSANYEHTIAAPVTHTVVLKPEEFYDAVFPFDNLQPGTYNAKMTTECAEGTKGTMTIIFKIE